MHCVPGIFFNRSKGLGYPNQAETAARLFDLLRAVQHRLSIPKKKYYHQIYWLEASDVAPF